MFQLNFQHWGKYGPNERAEGRYQNGELFLKHSRLIKTPIIKMANFFGVIKMANIFLLKWRTFSKLSKWRTFALSKWRTFFIKMANFFYQNGELFALAMKCLIGFTQKNRLFAQIQNSRPLLFKKIQFFPKQNLLSRPVAVHEPS